MSDLVANRQDVAAISPLHENNAPRKALFVNSLVAICLTCLLTASDAFETGHLGLFHQLALWSVVTILLVTQVSLIHLYLQRYLSNSLAPKGTAVILTIIATVLLMTVELHWLKFTPLLPKHPDPLLEFLLFLAPPVIAMAGLILAFQFLAFPSPIGLKPTTRSRTHYGPPAGEAGNSQELTSILGNKAAQHIQAQDHYLEIVFEGGKELVRARMKDAVAHLTSAEGVQIHRSHWVAYRFMQRVVKDGRDYKLVLKNGATVPVARSRVSSLRNIREV